MALIVSEGKITNEGMLVTKTAVNVIFEPNLVSSIDDLADFKSQI